MESLTLGKSHIQLALTWIILKLVGLASCLLPSVGVCSTFPYTKFPSSVLLNSWNAMMHLDFDRLVFALTRFGCSSVAIFLFAHSTIVFAQEDVMLTAQATVHFGSLEEGQELVSKVDDFVLHMQPLERQIRLESKEPVSREDYLQFLKDQVKEWDASEVEALTLVVEQLRGKLERFQVPLPEKIVLVRASEKMEGNAPHCRGPAIILPDSFFRSSEGMLKVLTHELFHVMSSHHVELRDQLYGIIGFERCNEIALPDAWAAQRLTNPDAPRFEHYLSLKSVPAVGEAVMHIVPVTLTKSDRYTGGSFFDYLDFRLMVVERKGESWQPQLDEGKPKLLSAALVPEYLKRIGQNTNYIIHPEEILADNFWMLVLEKRDVPDAWVLEKMRDVLSP